LADHRADLPPRLHGSRRVKVLDEDALLLPSVPDGSVTAIVTDPPWGEYEELDQPYEQFTRGMLASFDRVLHPHDGRVVVLVSRRASAGVAELWLKSPLQARDSYDILVNGHPASVLVGGR
jgi:tRNA G10  N-methylase Trm11